MRKNGKRPIMRNRLAYLVINHYCGGMEKGLHTWEQICKPDEGWSGTAPCPRLCTENKVLKIFNVNMFVH